MSAGVKLNVWFWRCRDVLTCTFVLVADLCKLFLMSINIIPSASNSKCDCTISKKWISVGWSSTCTHSPCRAISDRGFHVHSSDVDVAFAPKAFWPSMLQFLIPTNSDIAMQRDVWGPVNTGCVVSKNWSNIYFSQLNGGLQSSLSCQQPGNNGSSKLLTSANNLSIKNNYNVHGIWLALNCAKNCISS